MVVCEKCGKSFSEKREIAHHLLIHGIPCSLCSRRFWTKNAKKQRKDSVHFRLFESGTEFQNVFVTAGDPPTFKEKKLVHGRTEKCVFCANDYEGLNHRYACAKNSRTSTEGLAKMFLAPGCQRCNMRYAATLILRRNVRLQICGIAKA